MAIKIDGTTIINDQTAYIDLAGTSAVKVPVGTQLERPGILVAGQMRFNSNTSLLESYDGAAWIDIGGVEDGVSTVSATAPVSPTAGELWWDSSSGTLKIYYDDGTSQQWVDASPTNQGQFTGPNTNFVYAPTGITPASGTEIALDTTFTLTASAYSDSLDIQHVSSDWQISTSNTFATTVVESLADTTNLTSYTVTGGLAVDGTYYWRARYRDTYGNVSNFSTPIEFVIFTPPPTLGDSYCGGFYIGTICAASTCYYVIMAPNSSGCAQCAWKTQSSTTAGTTSTVDGRANTYGPLNNGTHPAGNWTATRSIGGFSDWYLPAKDELYQLFTNRGSAPAGEGFAPAYWSSTETSAASAWSQRFDNGCQRSCAKTTGIRVRAVRREPI